MENAAYLIAVVDDEPAVLKALERLLRSAGFQVATFSTGAAFLASLDSRRPHCVVLDLHMALMNGFEVQTRLLADPSGCLPVVAMTAHHTVDSEQRVLSAGAIAYLKKPVDARSLMNAIQAAVEPAHL